MKSLDLILNWFKDKQWTPLPFQLEAWKAFLKGDSGLISVPTGAGKTYAAYLPALLQLKEKGLQVLYITPLRALARDLEKALQEPITDLQLPFRVEVRSGDTKSHQRQKQLKNPAEILLTTPESLAILLCDFEAKNRFSSVWTIIIDEWHELLSTKRGVLLELCLARLKKWNPQLQIWGLTATIGNLQEAAQACVGIDRTPTLISSHIPREVILETLLPDSLNKLPWVGLLGLRMVPYVLEKLNLTNSTLIFTNTRSQAERWYQALLEAKPEWKEFLALHHGSLDTQERQRIESFMKEGKLRIVVCTSSLDLGIDFPHVDQVIQIGSPKSIGRLIQRAGRSSHKPLTPCRLYWVPTHALEIIELKAFRLALSQGIVEKRTPLTQCYDVLTQHLMTCAIGGGFQKEEIYDEIKTTYAFRDLDRASLEKCLQFLVHGGEALTAYPEYKKLLKVDEKYFLQDRKLILRHKMNIGTIASNPQISVKLAKGKKLGHIDEKFITSINPGHQFLFAGKILQLVQYRDLTAYVRIGKGKPTLSTVWQGVRLPYSKALSELLRNALTPSETKSPESFFLDEILSLQKKISYLPRENELLIEIFKSAEGWHLFIYPLEGKNIHEGIASFIAHRLSKQQAGTYTLSANDYGFEILSPSAFQEDLLTSELFRDISNENEMEEISNLHELAKSHFRDIARIAGLVFQDYPGLRKNQRQVQITTGLLYEIFNKYDPTNFLLLQAKREVLQEKFEGDRMHQILKRLSLAKIILQPLRKLSPFALPLYFERVSSRLSTETLIQRIERIKASWKRK